MVIRAIYYIIVIIKIKRFSCFIKWDAEKVFNSNRVLFPQLWTVRLGDPLQLFTFRTIFFLPHTCCEVIFGSILAFMGHAALICLCYFGEGWNKMNLAHFLMCSMTQKYIFVYFFTNVLVKVSCNFSSTLKFSTFQYWSESCPLIVAFGVI